MLDALTFSAASPPFLGSRPVASPDVVILGAPLDLTETFRSGTSAAPQRIRLVSDCLETYSPSLGRDLQDIALSDWGDLDLADRPMAEALDVVEAAARTAATRALPIVLGGEHTLTLGVVRGLMPRYPQLAVVQIDAHLDLADEYDGKKVSHATVARRVSETVGPMALVQVGARSGTRVEFEYAAECLYSSSGLSLPAFVFEELKSRPVYLSIDIDVLDPAFAPGTGCPEPGGYSFRDLTAFLAALASLTVVGVDIVEVLPAIDVGDITSVAAAKLVRELALMFASRR